MHTEYFQQWSVFRNETWRFWREDEDVSRDDAKFFWRRGMKMEGEMGAFLELEGIFWGEDEAFLDSKHC